MKSFCFYLFSTKFLEINCMTFFMVLLELLAAARIFLQARAAALLEVVEPWAWPCHETNFVYNLIAIAPFDNSNLLRKKQHVN